MCVCKSVCVNLCVRVCARCRLRESEKDQTFRMGNPSGQPGNTKEERKVIIAEAHRNDLRRHECEAENPESSTVGVDQGKNNFEYPQKQEEEAEEEEGY